jgi:antitoxin HicB
MSMKSKQNSHIGSAFDDFLEEEGLLSEANTVAIKRVLAWKISQKMAEKGMTKASMAAAMGTSRSALDRLLDPENTSVTLNTLDRAAAVTGMRLQLSLVEDAVGGGF